MSAAHGTISLVVGATLLRLSVTGVYQRYVRVGMGPWLALTGIVVAVLGVATVVRALRRSEDDAHDDAHGHDHSGGRWVAWLLLAPVAALLLVAPPALGSYGVDRASRVDVRAGRAVFEALETGPEPVPMTLLEFSQRAADRDGASFDGRAVQLTGFVADDSAPFRLARYQIACCAVDAAPLVVRIVGTVGAAPDLDRWVTVTGVFDPGSSELPTLRATTITEIPAPEDPYE